MTELVEIQCPACDGTGLYSGMAEKAGCAVICTRCNGTGKSSISFIKFTGRKQRFDAPRVYKTSGGYIQGPEGDLFEGAGCSYEEWQNGKRPAPAKKLYCPFLWTSQDMQMSSHAAYGMYQEFCNRVSHLGGSINKCPLYSTKEKCWEEYEKYLKDWD